MSVRVVIPRPLSRHVGNREAVDVEVGDLQAMFEALSETYDLHGVFLTPEGDLQPYIRVIVGERLLTATRRDQLGGVKVAGETVEITTAFAGG